MNRSGNKGTVKKKKKKKKRKTPVGGCPVLFLRLHDILILLAIPIVPALQRNVVTVPPIRRSIQRSSVMS